MIALQAAAVSKVSANLFHKEVSFQTMSIDFKDKFIPCLTFPYHGKLWGPFSNYVTLLWVGKVWSFDTKCYEKTMVGGVLFSVTVM